MRAQGIPQMSMGVVDGDVVMDEDAGLSRCSKMTDMTRNTASLSSLGAERLTLRKTAQTWRKHVRKDSRRVVEGQPKSVVEVDQRSTSLGNAIRLRVALTLETRVARTSLCVPV
jgi:hypothetical protein